ncbi:hypothetical protein Ancab_017077 [Ancistrocladus abbreviatus]
MTANRKNIVLHVLGKIVIFSLLSLHAFSLNLDGTLLLALRYSVVSDPLSVFDTWHYYDQTPCSWAGVTCSTVGNNATPDAYRVISLVLPSSQLLGSIPPDLGYIEHLQQLDLSNNFFNGTLPSSLFNASELQVLSLANNFISDELPEYIGGLKSLSYLNLSHNALYGPIPHNLGTLRNLTVVSLKGNYITGNVPAGFNSTEILDLSSNLFNGSIPSSLGGLNMRYLNLSYNKLSGYVPLEFASQMLENSTIDLSFNNLTGQIPASKALLNQKSEAFAGNSDLCGKPLRKPCIIPSTLSSRPNVSATIAPAIAVIPETVDSNPSSSTNNTTILTGNHSGLKPTTIIGITLADTAGIAILGLVLVYLYQLKNKKQRALSSTQPPHPHAKGQNNGLFKDQFSLQQSIITVTDRNPTVACCCLKVSNHEAESSSESRTRSSSEAEEESKEQNGKLKEDDRKDGKAEGGGGSMVMVDGETELELETLLKASAYTLGASGSSIVYKAVLQNGTTFAVRRLGDSGVERMKDFENQVRGIAKIRHPNLVRVRGFYWGDDEKLVIYDYFPNGSLASSAYKKIGSSTFHLPLETRLKIARGVARGLTYIHHKKFVHGSLKPSNILLTPEMEPIISDLGLSWLVYGNNGCKGGGGSGRQFGSRRSMGSCDATQDLPATNNPRVNPFSCTGPTASPYQAPESSKNLKPNPKWDVYSFGIVLLELLTGKAYLDRELAQWTPSAGPEDRYSVLRTADVGIRAEVQARERDMMGILKLGFGCANLTAQKRPTMKEALQILEKSPLSSC